jgi:hypothetical protein
VLSSIAPAALAEHRSSLIAAAVGRCADRAEGQQAVLDEDFAALRILPPAVLQAREGAAPLRLPLQTCPARLAQRGHSARRLFLTAATTGRAAQVENYAENLGEILRGDRIESSLYDLQMKHDEYCKVLCPVADYKQCVHAQACWLPAPQQRI